MAEQTPPSDSVESQAREQTGQRQVRLRLDRREMKTAYANAFQTNATAEEVLIEFGLNQVIPTGTGADGGNVESEILFQISDRVILNYYSAKRLAMSLSQLVRRYEQQFGELKLNSAERSQAAPTTSSPGS